MACKKTGFDDVEFLRSYELNSLRKIAIEELSMDAVDAAQFVLSVGGTGTKIWAPIDKQQDKAASLPRVDAPASGVTSGGMDQMRAFLVCAELAQYTEACDEQGYDDLPFLKSLSRDAKLRVTESLEMTPSDADSFVRELEAADVAAFA